MFAATSRVSYVVIKVKHGNHVEIDSISVTATGNVFEVDSACDCPVKSMDDTGSLLLTNTTTFVACVVQNCKHELNGCNDDALCSFAFPQGLRVSSMDGSRYYLHELWSCVDSKCPLEGSASQSSWIESSCMQEHCFPEIAACEANRRCSGDLEHPLRQRVEECEVRHCVTAAPTAEPSHAPTVSPTASSILNTPGLRFFSRNENMTEVDHKEYYPAFQMNSIPILPEKIGGNVQRIEKLCELPASMANISYQGTALLISGDDVACTNEADALKDFVVSARLIGQNAYELGASCVVIYGNDEIAEASWRRSSKLARRNDINMPVLLVSLDVGTSLLGLLGEGEVSFQL